MGEQSNEWDVRIKLAVEFAGRWRSVRTNRACHVSDVAFLFDGGPCVIFTWSGVVDAVPVVAPVDVFRANFRRPSEEPR